MASTVPILLDGVENEPPAATVAGQRSWEIEYARQAVVEQMEQRTEAGEFAGLQVD
jgi:hypothetical protein